MPIEEKRKEFEAKGYKIVGEFHDDNDFLFVIYRLNDFNPFIFVTGDRLEWRIGLRYDFEIHQIVEDYNVEEIIKTTIERIARNK